MLKIGKIYRMPRPQQQDSPQVDGMDNFYYESRTPGIGFEFQRGIHNVRNITGPNGESRCPLIIISSTPRKAGSEDTPWRDRYDSEHGYVKYYGDNKPNRGRPENAPGNRILLELLKYYDSPNEAERLKKAVPVIFFEKCSYDGRPKGNAIFHGFGLLESIELVTQCGKNQEYFANYLFNFCIFSLTEDNEEFNWKWIEDRCDQTKNVEDTMRYAPASWKRWIREGKESLHLVRRNISGYGLVKDVDQLPTNPQILNDIYHYYDGRKHEFEYLAMEITMKIIEESGTACVPGWITKKSGDGGIDYILRIDIGKEKLSSVNIIVLGQAKCTDPSKATNGTDIARTVARMKRGWIGAYVTTSYFSESVQKEVKEGSYPIMMINGAKVAAVVERELFETKQHLGEYLSRLKEKYKQLNQIPEDVLEV